MRTLVGFSLLLALTATPAAFTSPGGAAQPSARAGAGDLIDPKLGINPTFTVWTGTIHVIKNVKSHGVSADGRTTTDNQYTVDAQITIGKETIVKSSYSGTASIVSKPVGFPCLREDKTTYTGSYEGHVHLGRVGVVYDTSKGNEVIQAWDAAYPITYARTLNDENCRTYNFSGFLANPTPGDRGGFFPIPVPGAPDGSTQLVGSYSPPPYDNGSGTTSTVQYSFNLHMCGEESSVLWVGRYPDSKKLGDLSEPFRGDVERFLAALKHARRSRLLKHGQPYRSVPAPLIPFIATTYRPDPRAYLMHYAFRVAGGKPGSNQFSKLNPAQVPVYKNSGRDPHFKKDGTAAVPICWQHRDADGNVTPETEKASIADAKQMRSTFGVIRFGAAFPSNHSSGNAIDMSFFWGGTLLVKDAKGDLEKVKTGKDLFAVGASYGVKKHIGQCGGNGKPDPPHWSSTGC